MKATNYDYVAHYRYNRRLFYGITVDYSGDMAVLALL